MFCAVATKPARAAAAEAAAAEITKVKTVTRFTAAGDSVFPSDEKAASAADTHAVIPPEERDTNIPMRGKTA